MRKIMIAVMLWTTAGAATAQYAGYKLVTDAAAFEAQFAAASQKISTIKSDFIQEKNLSLLALGQKALASADAFPKGVFAAELGYINPSIDAQRGAVAVRLRVPSPPAYLRQDMTVSVDIEVARRAGALVVPADAVRDIAGVAPWVMVLVDGRATRRPVKVGARSVAMVEILDGLTVGDRAIPVTRGDIVEGRRLRAVPP